jgi:hypothetical protein
MEIRYSHPDQGLAETLIQLRMKGIESPSRNGPVIRFPEAVMLVNENPLDRVSTWDVRDANPFFHFMESLWMLAGMNEVAPMAYYNAGIAQYSDDKEVLRGTAYGHKWRTHFGYDQLELAIKRLSSNPEDRRVVMTMWDPRTEWRDPTSKDLSCNLQMIFGTRSERHPKSKEETTYLDMEVTNRSNDIVYGCLGSNVFHFTMLQEFVANACGFKVGKYYQVAFNLHGYLENDVFKRCYQETSKGNAYHFGPREPVETSYMKEFPFDGNPTQIRHFILTGDPGTDEYLQRVALPIYESYRAWKINSRGLKMTSKSRAMMAIEIVKQCADPALAQAGAEWLNRKGGM